MVTIRDFRNGRIPRHLFCVFTTYQTDIYYHVIEVKQNDESVAFLKCTFDEADGVHIFKVNGKYFVLTIDVDNEYYSLSVYNSDCKCIEYICIPDLADEEFATVAKRNDPEEITHYVWETYKDSE